MKIHLALIICLASGAVGCADLSFPEDPGAPESRSAPVSNPSADTAIASTTAGLDAGATPEAALRWNDLTRLAREHRQRGEFDEAEERLAQAQSQVALLPASDARRRAVFGDRASLARTMAQKGEVERADLLAQELFTEVEAEPGLAGPSFSSLAYDVASRRESDYGSATAEAGGQAGEDVTVSTTTGSAPPDGRTRLDLLVLALRAAQTESASLSRMDMAYRVAIEAQEAADLDIALEAIDQALSDAQRTAPSDGSQLAVLRVMRAEILLEQDEAEAALADALFATRELKEADATLTNRIVANAALVRAYLENGNTDAAREEMDPIWLEFEAAKEGEVHDFSQRHILAAKAALEAAEGDRTAAIERYHAALKVPHSDIPTDRVLRARVQRELSALETAEISPIPEVAAP